jgi:hypothetical protein
MEEKEGRLSIKFEATNIGNTPATHVEYRADLGLDIWGGRIRYDELGPPRVYREGGATIFLGATVRYGLGLLITDKKISGFRASYKMPEWPDPWSNPVRLPMVVVGRVAYSVWGSNSVHQSGIIREVYRVNVPIAQAGIGPGFGDAKKNDIFLMASPHGGDRIVD